MNPPCQQCKFYNTGRYSRVGFCTQYIAYRGRGKLIHEFAENAREDPSKCGPSGRMFKRKDDRDDSIWKSLLDDDE